MLLIHNFGMLWITVKVMYIIGLPWEFVPCPYYNEKLWLLSMHCYQCSIYLSVLSSHMSNASMTANASIGSEPIMKATCYRTLCSEFIQFHTDFRSCIHQTNVHVFFVFVFNVMFCCTDTHSATFCIHWLIMWLQPTEQPQEVTCFVGWQKFSNARFYRNDHNGVLLVFLRLLLPLPLLINPMRLYCWEI